MFAQEGYRKHATSYHPLPLCNDSLFTFQFIRMTIFHWKMPRAMISYFCVRKPNLQKELLHEIISMEINERGSQSSNEKSHSFLKNWPSFFKPQFLKEVHITIWILTNEETLCFRKIWQLIFLFFFEILFPEMILFVAADNNFAIKVQVWVMSSLNHCRNKYKSFLGSVCNWKLLT